MDLGIDVTRDGDLWVFVLSGDVDVHTSPDLKRRILEAIDGECGVLVLDLGGVDFIDSSGLGVLVGSLRRLKEQGGDLRLVHAHEPVMKVLRITGLDRIFPIFGTVDEAR